MNFDEWWRAKDINGGFTLETIGLVRLAWDHQQKKIDELGALLRSLNSYINPGGVEYSDVELLEIKRLSEYTETLQKRILKLADRCKKEEE